MFMGGQQEIDLAARCGMNVLDNIFHFFSRIRVFRE